MMKIFKIFLFSIIFFILLFKFITFYYISQGDKYLEEKNYQKAIFYYKKLGKIKDKNIHYNLAEIYYKIDKLDEAIEELKEFLKFEPNSADVYHLLSIFYYEKDDLNNAEKNCETASRLNEKFSSDLRLIKEEKLAERPLSKKMSKNFIVKFNSDYEETSASVIIDLLEKIHQKISPLHIYLKEKKTVVKIYDDFTFEKVTGSSASYNFAAVINNKIFLHSPRFFLISRNIEEIITHEYVHLIIHRIVKGYIPVYLNEGIADLFSEGGLSGRGRIKLKESYLENKLLPFIKLRNNWDKLNKEEKELAYIQAQSFVNYLVQNFHWEIVGKLLQEFSKEEKEDLIFKKLTGKELKDLEENWKKYILQSS